jgi:eukaryotic-like serine/threonine-protein kinase
MAVVSTTDQFLTLLDKSGLVAAARVDAYLRQLDGQGRLPADPKKLATRFVRDGLLTKLQAEQILQGKSKGFVLNGKYKVLELLGVGSMGKVFLGEHVAMRRLVAVKVLPIDHRLCDAAVLARFYREARALASLDHPNIVWAYDLDRDERVHFLVMEYVDGASLQDVVKAHGPLDVPRACHYVAQAAAGLEHAHAAGWVHRDVKPANLLLDRAGTVKLTDLGLARLFDDKADVLTQRYGHKCVLGTADYLSPEQAVNSSGVDRRTDLYSLGATFYFLVTGSPPFPHGSVGQKLLYHRTQRPKPVRELRPGVPAALAAVVDRLMAKEPAERYQTAAAVIAALAPWTAKPVAPPPEREMPRHSTAVARLQEASRPARGPAAAPAGDSALADTRVDAEAVGEPKTVVEPRSSGDTPVRADPPVVKRRVPRLVLVAGAFLIVTAAAALGVYGGLRTAAFTALKPAPPPGPAPR